MIAKMRRVTLLAATGDRDALVQRLFDAGVLHLDALPAGNEPVELAAARTDLELLDAATVVLANVPSTESPTAAVVEPLAMARQVKTLAAEATECDRALVQLGVERSAIAPFGLFEPAQVHALRKAGVFVELYTYPKGSAPDLPSGASLQELSIEDGTVAVAVVSRQPIELDLRPLSLPARGLAAVDREIEAFSARATAATAELRRLAPMRTALLASRAVVVERVDWQEARARLAANGPVVVLTGFVPKSREEALLTAFRSDAVAMLIRDVNGDDVVPTLLEGPSWVRQVHTVFQGIGIVPGYAEADVSSLFLVFLLLFAAMLIGDAGYGVLLVVLGAVAWHKTKSKPAGVPQAVRLLLTTGVATVVWGAITATWFALPNLPAVFDTLRIDWLAPIDQQTGQGDKVAATKNIMLLCFVLGAVHLTLAHLWAALRCGRTVQALAQLGWVGCTWLMFLLARTMVLGEQAPSYTVTLAVVAIAAVALFMTPIKLIKAEWFNHVMLPLSLVSNFVDVVSYLRLFAVGSAGVAVAQSFNAMAANAAAGGGAGYLLAAFIAIFGHTLNLLLAAMAVLVHGVRLNTLEFSAHLGLQWSGVPYRPFGRRTPAAVSSRATTATNGSEV